jgi:two-component system, cell cycle sensor histidine kinase and response regulator CckA
VLRRALDVRRLRVQNIGFQQLAGIYALSMVIRLTPDFHAILQKVADAALGHSQVCGVSLLLAMEDGKSLRVALTRGVHNSQDVGKRITFTPALTRWVEDSLQLRSQPNELADVHDALPLSLPELPDGVSVPMLAGGNFIGILNVTSAHPGRPDSPGHIKALNILAGAAAFAVESASLLEQLRTSEQRYRRLSESAPDAIFRYELLPQRRFSYVNAAAESIVGYSPEEFYADPELIFTLVHPDDRRLMEEVLSGGRGNGSAVTLRWVHRSGKAVWIELRNTLVHDADGSLIAIESIARDISERRQLEDQLRQSQKMEAIGLLAGGVAHDFNNLLTVILGYADLIVSDDEPSGSTAEKLAQVKKAAEQASDLTGRLLAFGRRQLVHPTVLNLNTIVEKSLKMLRPIIGDDITLVTALDADLGCVKADAAQIEQILLNLAVNSKSAMPQGGKISLETKNVPPEAACAGNPTPGGGYIMLSVADTGCGMDAPTQARIFEPFFSTKPIGKGTGLGLSIIYGIVTQNGGQIRVVSHPGQGAKFEILLPRSEELEESPTLTDTQPETLEGCETILVVEDDPGVRQLIGAILHNRGYDALIACDAAEAIRICGQHDGKIALIVTDVMMPGMSGTDLVKSLQQLHPGIRVLFMSGYAGESSNSQIAREMAFIQKPFTAVKLTSKIRELLDVGRMGVLRATVGS